MYVWIVFIFNLHFYWLTFQNGESKPIPSEKRSSIDEKPKKKVLPELDKYWKVVNDDPTDFTGWTYLLQYVDQEVLNLHSYNTTTFLLCIFFNFYVCKKKSW